MKPSGKKAAGYVIIGNSAAGVAAAEAIRELDRQTPVTIIADEPHRAYGRPLTSYILGDKVTRDQLWIRPEDAFEKLGVEMMLGRRVTAVDDANTRLTLEDGSEVGYRQLLVATGGSPRRLPVAGADLEGVFYLRTLDDSDAILGYLQRTRRVVLCGGGLVTAKAMDALRLVDNVESMTMVEIMPSVLSQILDGEPAAMMKDHFQENGVDVRVEMSIEEVLGEGGCVSGVKLKSGEVIECEMVIVGMGVIPNTGLLESSAVETDQGIIVDHRMRTNVSSVYSAGDVAQVPDFINGGTRICAIWPAACEQGRIAGINMAGGRAVYAGGIGMNSAEFYGLKMIAAGNTRAGEGMTLHEQRAGSKYRRLVIREGRLAGFVMLGDVSHAGVLTSFIRSGEDISNRLDSLLSADLVRFAAERASVRIQSSSAGREAVAT